MAPANLSHDVSHVSDVSYVSLEGEVVSGAAAAAAAATGGAAAVAALADDDFDLTDDDELLISVEDDSDDEAFLPPSGVDALSKSPTQSIRYIRLPFRLNTPGYVLYVYLINCRYLCQFFLFPR